MFLLLSNIDSELDRFDYICFVSNVDFEKFIPQPPKIFWLTCNNFIVTDCNLRGFLRIQCVFVDSYFNRHYAKDGGQELLP